MAWVIAIVVLVLLVVSAGFRKLALGLVVIAVVGGVIAYLYGQAEEKQSLTRIPVSQLVFENVRLNPDYSSYKLSGRIKNNSAQFTLTKLVFAITMQDCTGDVSARNCVTIGETNESVYLTVPPGQARDFQDSVYFSGGALKPKGRLEWNYSVSQTMAK